MADPQDPFAALGAVPVTTPAATPAADPFAALSVPSAAPVSAATTQPSGGPLSHGVAEFFSNFDPVAMAKAFTPDNAVEAAFGPLGAIGGHLVDAAKARLTQAKAAYAAGDPAQAALHVLGALPIVGPAIDKIGSGIKNQDSNQLAEGLGDAAALGAGAMFDPGAAMAKVGDVVSGVADTASDAAMTRAIAPTSGAQKSRFGAMAADVAPRLASEPGLGSLSTTGLATKIGSKLEDAEGALDAATDARLKGRPIDTTPIQQAIQSRIDALTAQPMPGSLPQQALSQRTSPIVGPTGQPITVDVSTPQPIGQPVVPDPNAARVATLQKALGEVQALGPIADYDALKVIRQAYDGPAKKVYSPASGDDFNEFMGTKYASADIAGAVRDQLGQADPATAAANGEYSFWRKADDVLQAQQEAARVAPNRLKTAVLSGVGSTLGYHMEGGMGALTGAFLGPALDAANAMGYTTKIAVSRQLARLSDALSAGDGADASTAMRNIATMTRTLPALNQVLAGAQASATGGGS
jgi:hypothetical protein